MSKRAEILKEAEKCICGKREQDYGSPEDNFTIIAGLWTAYTGTKITPLDVAMMMCLLKTARVKNGGGTEKIVHQYGKPLGYYTSLSGAVKAIARAEYKDALSGRKTPLSEAIKIMQETVDRFEKILEEIKE